MESHVHKLYQLDCETVITEHVSIQLEQENDINLWHQWLGHFNVQQLKEIIQKEHATSVKFQKKLT